MSRHTTLKLDIPSVNPYITLYDTYVPPSGLPNCSCGPPAAEQADSQAAPPAAVHRVAAHPGARPLGVALELAFSNKKGLGFWVLGFRVLGFRVLGF